MPDNLTAYHAVRDQMRTGDVIAFSGKGRVSDLIKWKTSSEYSHVGMVLPLDLEGHGRNVFLVESTTLVDQPSKLWQVSASGASAVTTAPDIVKGVQLQWLSKRMESYDGDAWWVPLRYPLTPEAQDIVHTWLRQKVNARTPYDTTQALGAGMDFWDSLGLENDPDFSRLFCSELVARALQLAGRIPADLNASEQTPADVVAMDIFDQDRITRILGGGGDE